MYSIRQVCTPGLCCQWTVFAATFNRIAMPMQIVTHNDCQSKAAGRSYFSTIRPSHPPYQLIARIRSVSQQTIEAKNCGWGGARADVSSWRVANDTSQVMFTAVILGVARHCPTTHPRLQLDTVVVADRAERETQNPAQIPSAAWKSSRRRPHADARSSTMGGSCLRWGFSGRWPSRVGSWTADGTFGMFSSQR
jgi:hypothetical protein